MNAYERMRELIKTTIVRDIPRGFWADAREGTKQTYMDSFHEVDKNPNVVEEQRAEFLHQHRHFRMEHLFQALAKKFGLASSATMLQQNGRHYMYATRGSVGLTQAYVPTIGAMPQPRRYREKLASMNAIPRFDLGDEPSEVLIGKDFYGLLAHNPVGKKFSEHDQRLGMLQFCVPTNDGKAWGAELAVEEILAAYPDMRPAEVKPERKPVWKHTDKLGNAE